MALESKEFVTNFMYNLCWLIKILFYCNILNILQSRTGEAMRMLLHIVLLNSSIDTCYSCMFTLSFCGQLFVFEEMSYEEIKCFKEDNKQTNFFQIDFIPTGMFGWAFSIWQQICFVFVACFLSWVNLVFCFCFLSILIVQSYAAIQIYSATWLY